MKATLLSKLLTRHKWKMSAEVSSDEEFHSAPEGEESEHEEEKGSERVKLKNQADERLSSQLESMNLKSSETADNDSAASQSVNISPDGGSVTSSQMTDMDAKVTGLDNRYVSEDHTPDEGGAVELTEEQIKVCPQSYSDSISWVEYYGILKYQDLFRG